MTCDQTGVLLITLSLVLLGWRTRQPVFTVLACVLLAALIIDSFLCGGCS